MKKIFLLSTAAVVCFGAQGFAGTPKAFTPYAGVQFGAASMSSKVTSSKAKRIDTNALTLDTLSSNADLSGRGFIGGIHLGVDYAVTPEFISGVEVGYDLLSSSKGKSQSTFRDSANGFRENKLTIQQRNRYSIAARLKYMVIEKVAPYIKLGYDNASFRATSALESTRIANTAQRTETRNKRLGAFLMGVGVDANVSEYIRLGLEYTYTKYGKINMVHSFRDTTAQKEVTRTFKPQTSAVQARLSYTF